MLDQFAGVCKNEVIKGDLSRTCQQMYGHEEPGKKKKRCGTYKDVFPASIIPFEIQAVLPKVGRNGAVRLQVHVVGISRPRISAEA